MDQPTRRLAVVTGASSGIGLELARQFAAHDHDVIAAAEDDQIHAVAAELSSTRAIVTPAQVDLTTYDGVESLARAVSETERPVDALALNAGIGAGGAFVSTPLESDLEVIALNVTSTVHLAKRIISDMAARRHGRVLVTASVASTMPGPYYATYAASKAFLLSFAEAIRRELASSDVTVTALLPGPTETNFFRRAGLERSWVGRARKDDPAEVAADGFQALMAGRSLVVAGSLKNRVQTIMGRLLPESLNAALHGRMVKPPRGR